MADPIDSFIDNIKGTTDVNGPLHRIEIDWDNPDEKKVWAEVGRRMTQFTYQPGDRPLTLAIPNTMLRLFHELVGQATEYEARRVPPAVQDADIYIREAVMARLTRDGDALPDDVLTHIKALIRDQMEDWAKPRGKRL
jgi:hypothetical protein